MNKLTMTFTGLLLAGCLLGAAAWAISDNHWILANASQRMDINNCVANTTHSNYVKGSPLDGKKIMVRVDKTSPSGIFVKVQPAFAEVVYFMHIKPGKHTAIPCSGAHIVWSSDNTRRTASGSYTVGHV